MIYMYLILTHNQQRHKSPQKLKHRAGWQFNWLFGRLNHGLKHGLNHFTVLGDDLGDDLGHALGGQIANWIVVLGGNSIGYLAA